MTTLIALPYHFLGDVTVVYLQQRTIPFTATFSGAKGIPRGKMKVQNCRLAVIAAWYLTWKPTTFTCWLQPWLLWELPLQQTKRDPVTIFWCKPRQGCPSLFSFVSAQIFAFQSLLMFNCFFFHNSFIILIYDIARSMMVTSQCPVVRGKSPRLQPRVTWSLRPNNDLKLLFGAQKSTWMVISWQLIGYLQYNRQSPWEGGTSDIKKENLPSIWTHAFSKYWV